MTEILDLAGEVCPYTFVRTKLRLEELPLGAELTILVDHAPAAENVPRSLAAEGQQIVSVSPDGARWRIVTIKRSEPHLRHKRNATSENATSESRGRGTMSTLQDAIAPHGGKLVNRVADANRAGELRTRALKLPRIDISVREIADLELIAVGALSPLDGFMCRANYERVIGEGRLANGLPWTIPVTLSAPSDLASGLSKGAEAALYFEGTLHAILSVEETFSRDAREYKSVYGTDDDKHPGVAQLKSLSESYLGGTIELIEKQKPLFPTHHNEPAATRAYFREKGWKRISAFQTRNPIHRAHEYLTKVALEVTDGILIHPLVGYTKGDDIPADVRVKCYEALLADYYPKDRVLLSTLPAAMRYAGPKEAIFHATMRKNYGCTHFIVGRDHAGVGNYYGTYDAQREFDKYTPEEIGITPLRFENSFFCKSCGAMASEKTCPHGNDARVILSGTKVRDMLKAGQEPPAEFSRPEVARILIDAMKG